jgi:hypothetical protein
MMFASCSSVYVFEEESSLPVIALAMFFVIAYSLYALSRASFIAADRSSLVVTV